MKKFFYVFVALSIMVVGGYSANAQVGRDTMDVPMGCFENWESYPSESVSLMFMTIPVGYDYELPEGWSIPKYEVNETLNYSGLNIPISATIPVAKVWNDTVNMPQGHGALVAQTILLEDVVNPTVYALASSLLDSSLRSTVLPSIVATGEIHLDKFIDLMGQILDNDEDLSWLLPILDTIDINDYLSGGFPLNGFEPKRLTGYYKYIQGDVSLQRDNGAILAIGTRYDTLTHRRTLVGAGSKNLFQLYDSVDYEPFYMDYFSLSEYFPADYDYQEADSMIVVVVSSASDKARTRYSRLYVDSLRLVSKNADCGHLVNVEVAEVGVNVARVVWNNTAAPDRWEVEYGHGGFAQGSGTLTTVRDSSIVVANLDYDTDYDFYVRGLCGDTAYTDWMYTSCHTDSLPRTDPPVGLDAVEQQVRVYPNPAQGRVTVDMADAKVQGVKLYSIEGRELLSAPPAQGQMVIDLPYKGLFVIEVMTENGNVRSKVANR